MATSSEDRISSAKLATFATKLWTKLKATFYAKPDTGIPKDDLSSAVQTSLGLADTALQDFTEADPVFGASPAAGITADDISGWNIGSQPEIFWCTYGTTTTEEIAAAIEAGKLPAVSLTVSGYNAIALYVGEGYRMGYRFQGAYGDNRIISVVATINTATGELEWNYSMYDYVSTDGTSPSGKELSGTWGIDISGNAATATTATTASTAGTVLDCKDTSKEIEIAYAGSQLSSFDFFAAFGTSDNGKEIMLRDCSTVAARKKINGSSAGSSTQPVYINANGLPTACTAYSEASVKSAASATTATSATSATKATQDGSGNTITSTYQTLATKSISGTGVSNAAYVAPAILCVRDGSAVTATSVSGIVNACCSSAYRANKGRLYTILNTSSSSVTITGFAGSNTWSLPANTFMNCIYWGSAYYREDN